MKVNFEGYLNHPKKEICTRKISLLWKHENRSQILKSLFQIERELEPEFRESRNSFNCRSRIQIWQTLVQHFRAFGKWILDVNWYKWNIIKISLKIPKSKTFINRKMTSKVASPSLFSGRRTTNSTVSLLFFPTLYGNAPIETPHLGPLQNRISSVFCIICTSSIFPSLKISFFLWDFHQSCSPTVLKKRVYTLNWINISVNFRYRSLKL